MHTFALFRSSVLLAAGIILVFPGSRSALAFGFSDHLETKKTSESSLESRLSIQIETVTSEGSDAELSIQIESVVEGEAEVKVASESGGEEEYRGETGVTGALEAGLEQIPSVESILQQTRDALQQIQSGEVFDQS